MESIIQNIEVKAFNDDTGEFEGYASTFGNVDNGKDICVKGCFDESLIEMEKSGTMPGMFWQHDKAEPIGEWLSMATDSKGLYVKGRLWIKQGIQRADQAYKMIKSKGPKGLSIGFIAKSVKKIAGGIREIVKASLIETSVVTFPMNEKAVILSVKAAEDQQIADMKQRIRDHLAMNFIQKNIDTLTA